MKIRENTKLTDFLTKVPGISSDLKKALLTKVGKLTPNEDPQSEVANLDMDKDVGLCCPLSLDVFSTPIIVSSGRTFDKSLLVDHMKKNGYTCPVSRKEIHPNLILNQAILNNVAYHGLKVD